jgi:hypothetical protein
MPADVVKITDQEHAALLEAQAQGHAIEADENGAPVARPRALTPEKVAASLSIAVQAHVDGTARALGYDNALAAISYADEPSVPQYQAEGVALRAWRSLVWAAADKLIASGNVDSAEALIKKLPKFTRPAA